MLAVEYAPTVQLKNGKVRGIVQEVVDVGNIYSYQGIRYGRAERFAKPKPAESWNDVYDATGYKFACPQRWIEVSDKVVHNVTQLQTLVANEDCLFVNVWRPIAASKEPRAVMAWIHGGSFTQGTIFSEYYDGRFISSLGDVIVVTINYRLDAFGFLYTGTEDAPGNVGLHDQILALKWIQENIASFGGDPKKVTVLGESAGSFSTGALVLSPLTKGLFRRAIMQSGAPNSYLGSQNAKTSLEAYKSLAIRLKCSNEDTKKVVQCLRTKSVKEVLTATADSLVNAENFIPVYGDELLPVSPVEALKTGKFHHDIDLMYGTTKNEGSMFVVQLLNLPQLDPTKDGKDLTVDLTKKIISFMMSLFHDPNPDEVADYYTKNLNESDKDELRRAVSYVFGDYHLVCPTMFYGEHFMKLAPQNNYYSYRLMKATKTPVMFCHGWMGVCHGEDVVFFFGLPLRLKGTAFTDDEAELALDFIHTWSNFAKTGHPGKLRNIEWKSARKDDNDEATRFIEIGENPKMVSDYYKTTCDAFWKPRMFN